MKINIYTTGGTIDKVYFDQKSDYQVGDPQANGVLERANVVLDYEVESIIRKDSLDFTEEDRELIRKKVASTPLEKVVITHGTDTMIDTAKVLKNISGKTIVMTGSKLMMDLEQKIAIVLLLLLLAHFCAEAASKSPECVVLLHGLARSEKSLLKLERYIENKSFCVANIGYPFIMNDERVLQQIVAFINNGMFSRVKPTEPSVEK